MRRMPSVPWTGMVEKETGRGPGSSRPSTGVCCPRNCRICFVFSEASATVASIPVESVESTFEDAGDGENDDAASDLILVLRSSFLGLPGPRTPSLRTSDLEPSAYG